MSRQEKKDIFSDLEQWTEAKKDHNKSPSQTNFQNNPTLQVQPNENTDSKPFQQSGIGFRPHSPLDNKANLSRAGRHSLRQSTDPDDEDLNNLLKNLGKQTIEKRQPQQDFDSGIRDRLKKDEEHPSSQNNMLKSPDRLQVPGTIGYRRQSRDPLENLEELARNMGLIEGDIIGTSPERSSVDVPYLKPENIERGRAGNKSNFAHRSKSSNAAKSQEKKRATDLESLESFIENELKSLDVSERRASAGGITLNVPKHRPSNSLAKLDLATDDKKKAVPKKKGLEDDYDDLARILGLSKDDLMGKLKEEGGRKSGPSLKRDDAAKEATRTGVSPARLGGVSKTDKAKKQRSNSKSAKKDFLEDDYDELAKILGIDREELMKKLNEEEVQKKKEEEEKSKEESPKLDAYDELAMLLGISREEVFELLRAARMKRKFDNTDTAKKKKRATLEEEYDELAETLGIPKKDIKERLKSIKKNRPDELEVFFDKILNQELPDEKKINRREPRDHIVELEELAGRLGAMGPDYKFAYDSSSSPTDPVVRGKVEEKQRVSPKKPLEDDYDELSKILGIDRDQLMKKLQEERQRKKAEEEQKALEAKSLWGEYDALADVLEISRAKLMVLLREARNKRNSEQATSKKKKPKRTLEDNYDDFAAVIGLPKKDLKAKIKANQKKLPDNLDAYFDKIMNGPLPEEKSEQLEKQAEEDEYDELARVLGMTRPELTKKLNEKKHESYEDLLGERGSAVPQGDEYDELALTLDIPREDLIEILRGRNFETPDPSKKRKKRTLEEDYDELAVVLGIPKKDLKEKFKARKRKLPWDLEVFFDKILNKDPPEEIAQRKLKKDHIKELEDIAEKLKRNKGVAMGDLAVGSSLTDSSKKSGRGRARGRLSDRKNTFDEDYDELANILGMDQSELIRKLKELEEESQKNMRKREQEALTLEEKQRIIREEKQKLEEEKRLLLERLEEEEKKRRQENAAKYQKERLEELEKLQSKYQTDSYSGPHPLEFDHEDHEEDAVDSAKRPRHRRVAMPDPSMIPYVEQHHQNIINLDKFKRGLMGEYDVRDLPGGSNIALRDFQDDDDYRAGNRRSSIDSDQGLHSKFGNEAGSGERGYYYSKGRRGQNGQGGENSDGFIMDLDSEDLTNEKGRSGSGKRYRKKRGEGEIRPLGRHNLKGKTSLGDLGEHSQDRIGHTNASTLDHPSSQEDLMDAGSGKEGYNSESHKRRGKRIETIAEVNDGKLEESSPMKHRRRIPQRNQKGGQIGMLSPDKVDTKAYYTDEYSADSRQTRDARRELFYLGEEYEIPFDQTPTRKIGELGLDPDEWEEVEIIEEYEIEVTDETDDEPDNILDELEEEKAEAIPILIAQNPKPKKKKKVKKTKTEKILVKKREEEKRQKKINQFIDDYGFLEALARNTLQFDLPDEETRDEFGDKDVVVLSMLYRSYLILRMLGKYFTAIMNAALKPIDYEELVHPRAYFKALKDKINIRITKNVALLVAFFTFMMTIYCLAVADAGDISRVRNDQKKNWVAHRLVPGAIIFTYYGIILLEIKDRAKLWLLFILQCVPPGIILIVDLAKWYAAGRVNLPFNRMCSCIYAVVLFLFWWVTKLIREDSMFAYTWKFSMVLSIFWFALVFVWIMGFAIYYSITPKAYNFDWGYGYTVFLAIPTMILTAVTWVYWHARFLTVPSKIHLMNKITDENKKKLFQDFPTNRIPLVQKIKLIKQKATTVKNKPESKYLGETRLEKLLKQLDEQDEREQAIAVQNQMKDSIVANLSTNATISMVEESKKDIKPMPVLSNAQGGDVAGQNLSSSVAKRKKRRAGSMIRNLLRTTYRNIKNQLILFSSTAMGGTLLLMMSFIIIHLLNVLNGAEMSNPSMFYLSVFFYFFTPLFLILGFLLVGWQTKLKLKSTFVPVLAAFLPMFVTMPLANAMVNDEILSEIGTLLIFLPAMSVGFWLTISYFFERHRKIRTALVAFIFIFFYIPLLVVRSMREVNGFGSIDALGQFTEFTLVGIGALVVLSLFLYLIVRILIMDEAEVQGRYGNQQYKIMTMFRWDIQNWGYWANSLGFIVSTAITLWSYFHASRRVSQPLKGLVLGLTLVYLQTFYISNLALRLYVVHYRKDIKKTRLSFDDKLFADQDTHSQRISNFIENNDLKDKQLQRIASNSKVTRFLVVTHIGVLVPLFVILAIAFGGARLKQPAFVFLALAVGTLINMGLYHFYNEWKKYNPISSRFIVPAVITYVWIAVVCPLGALLPAANVFYGVNSEDYPKLQRITVGTIALWILVTIALLAIIANLFTKKVEFDRKVRFINNFMRRELDKIAVKSDSYILRKIYEDWINKGEKELSKMLKENGKPAFWWPIPKTCHLTQYSKMLIDYDAYKKLRIRFRNKAEGIESGDHDRDALDLTRKKYDNKKNWCNFCDGSKACHHCTEYCFPSVDEWGNPIRDPNEKKPVDLEDEPLEFAPKLEEILAVDYNDIQKIDLSGNGLGDDSDQDVDDEDYDPEGYAEDASVMGHKIEIMGVDFWPLDPRVYRAMIVYCFAVKVHVNQETKINFLKLVFRLFAIGNWREYDERWLDYTGYKKLLELSGIIPSRNFPDYMIDVVYSKYCHRDRGNKFEPINWERFEGFVTEIAKVKYPNETSDREALAKLIRYYMYPNLLHLLPSMHKGMPDEWRYMSYLINKYRKMAMQKRKLKALGFTKEEIDKILQLSDEEIESIIAQKEKEIAEAKERARLAAEEEAAHHGEENVSLMMGDEKYSGQNQRKKKPWSKCRRCMIALCSRTSKCWRAMKKGCTTLFKDIFFFNPNDIKPSRVDQYIDDLHKQEEEERKDARFDEKMEQGRKEDDFAEDSEEGEEEKVNIQSGSKGDKEGVDPLNMGTGARKKMKYQKKARKIYDHKPSPDWPVIVDVMMAAIQAGEREYSDLKDSLRNTPWKTSFANIVALIIRIVSIYSIGAFGFSPSIVWNIPDKLLAILISVNGYTGLGTYDALFIACFVIAFFYVALGAHALKDAKKGLLGTNINGDRTRFPQLRFFQSQLLNILSQALFIMFMKTFIAAYSCDFTTDPYVLYTDSEMICNSGKHKAFMVLAVFGMLLFYPIASFLYPNLQVADEADDLRYEPAFLVIETQSKLFLAGFAVFFPDAGTITVALSVGVFVNLGLAMLNKATVPGMIRVLVPWETGIYVAGAWLCICGIVVNQTGINYIGLGLLIVGWIVIFFLSAIGARKVRKFLKNRQHQGYKPVMATTAEKSPKKVDNHQQLQFSSNVDSQGTERKMKPTQEIELSKTNRNIADLNEALNDKPQIGSEVEGGSVAINIKDVHHHDTSLQSHVDLQASKMQDVDASVENKLVGKSGVRFQNRRRRPQQGSVIHLDDSDSESHLGEHNFSKQRDSSKPF